MFSHIRHGDITYKVRFASLICVAELARQYLHYVILIAKRTASKYAGLGQARMVQHLVDAVSFYAPPWRCWM
jgi:hypothetical protein